MAYDLVVIGASWGGLDALACVLPALPESFAPAVVVAQHRAHDSPHAALLHFLSRRSALPVSEVDDKDPIVPGAVHLAPADYHLIIEPGHFALSIEQAVRYSRPSIDVALETAADAYGSRVVGVVLTGANDDGARGLAAVRKRGGYAIAQDPDTAERRDMPEAAIRAGAVDRVAPLDEIAGLLVELCGTSPERSAA